MNLKIELAVFSLSQIGQYLTYNRREFCQPVGEERFLSAEREGGQKKDISKECVVAGKVSS